MGYTNSRATVKWLDPHTKKLKYYSSAKFDKHNNNFCKGWSLGSNFLNDADTLGLPTIKMIS